MKELKVLIVDDDVASVKLLTNMLQKEQYEFKFIESAHAVDAAEILKNEKNFDIIIIDLNLSGIDGIELLRIIKAEDNLLNIPVIITTSDDTRKIEATDYGASIFLVKPISQATLKSKTQELLLTCANS